MQSRRNKIYTYTYVYIYVYKHINPYIINVRPSVGSHPLRIKSLILTEVYNVLSNFVLPLSLILPVLLVFSHFFLLFGKIRLIFISAPLNMQFSLLGIIHLSLIDFFSFLHLKIHFFRNSHCTHDKNYFYTSFNSTPYALFQFEV